MEEIKECAHLVESVAEYLDSKCRVWKETLDRAYKDGKYNQNTGLWETDECKVSRARYTLDAYRDALSMVDTLGQQIDELRRPAPENKALTLNELRKMYGEPVYSPKCKWGIVGFIKVGTDEHGGYDRKYTVSFSYGWEWLDDVLHIGPLYRRRPEED